MAGKRWNGSAWIDHTTKKRWNGSAWVDLTIAKRWNGSSWVDIYAGGGGTLSFVISPFSDLYSCDKSLRPSCPITAALSDTNTYTVSGGTPPYTVTAVVDWGDPVTINTATAGQITLSASVGRNAEKTGNIKITVTDSAGSPVTQDFYADYSFSYFYIPDDPNPENPFYPVYPT